MYKLYTKQFPMNDPKSLQCLVWFAAFYEGEGSITNDICNRNRLHVAIAQNDRLPLDLAQKHWGGSVRQRTRVTASGKVCHGHEWSIKTAAAEYFIKEIRPFMIIPYKINQVEKAFKVLEEPWTKRFKCNYCDKTYADPSGRRRHERNTHLKAPTETQDKVES